MPSEIPSHARESAAERVALAAREDVEPVTDSGLSAHATNFGLALSTDPSRDDSASERDDSDPLLDTTVGDVLIESLLAVGGMGRVYRGRQSLPPRPVAVKFMRHTGTTELTKRFFHEVEVLGRLVHPNIAQIYTAGEHRIGLERLPYYVMELIPHAATVLTFCERAGLSISERVTLFLDACDAVAAGHREGIVHRDLKPANILVSTYGANAQPRLKVIDFGIAKAILTDGSEGVTEAGDVLGTRQYMSPEQFHGRPGEVDTRSDVYSLGVVLQELLTGQPPHDLRKRSLLDAARIVQTTPPRPLALPSKTVDRRLRRGLATVVARCLEKAPADRYANASALAADLRQLLGGHSLRPHVVVRLPFPLSLWGTTAAVLASTAALAMFLPTRLPTPERTVVVPPIPTAITNVPNDLSRPLRMAFAPHGTRAVLGRGLGRLTLLDVTATGKIDIRGTFEHAGVGGFIDVAWSSDGRLVYALSHEQQGGLHIIDATNPATASEIAFLPTPDYAHAIEVSPNGEIVFIADGNSGMVAVDVSSPEAPSILGSTSIKAFTQGITLSHDGRLAFLSCWHSGLAIFDVSDPSSMTLINRLDLPGDAWNSVLSQNGDTLYAADRDSAIHVVSIKDPTAPKVLSHIPDLRGLRRLIVSDDGLRLYATNGTEGVVTFDISSPEAPTFVSSHRTEGTAFDMVVVPESHLRLVVLAEGRLEAMRPEELAIADWIPKP